MTTATGATTTLVGASGTIVGTATLVPAAASAGGGATVLTSGGAAAGATSAAGAAALALPIALAVAGAALLAGACFLMYRRRRDKTDATQPIALTIADGVDPETVLRAAQEIVDREYERIERSEESPSVTLREVVID